MSMTTGTEINSNKILEVIAEALKSSDEWLRPWVLIEDIPRNYVGVKYNPLNAFLLSIEMMNKGYTLPFWATRKRIKQMGGYLPDHEDPTSIYVFTRKFVRTKEDGTTELKDTPPPKGKVKKRFPLIVHSVFNAEQATWRELPTEWDLPRYHNPAVKDSQVVETIQNYTMPYLNKYNIDLHFGGNRAAYDVLSDSILMPEMGSFKSPRQYAQVYMHEIMHSTGHKTRCDRFTKDNFNNKTEAYSLEELVAEMGSNYLLHDLGIPPCEDQIKNSAAYLNGWLPNLKKEPRLFAWADARIKKGKASIENTQGKKETIKTILRKVGERP